MRVIKTLFVSLLVLSIIGVVGYLVMREVLLLIAVSRVKNSLVMVRNIDTQQDYLTECMSRGSTRNEQGRVHSTQLRFLDRTEYVIEAICNQMEYNPIEVSRGKLPSSVVLEQGQSGLRWNSDAGLNFLAFNRMASVSVIDKMIITSLKPTVLAGHQGPPSECQSYGYQCCDQLTQLGTGLKINSALDCPQSCFETCIERPLLLSFASQPHYNRIDRTLEVSPGESVIFSYLATPNHDFNISYVSYDEADDLFEKAIAVIDSVFVPQPEAEQLTVFLDFGDGSQEEFSGLRGQAEHQYDCASNSCLYHAKLRVQKEDGIESLETPQSTIKVQVKGI